MSVLLLVGVSRLAAADVSVDLLGSDESMFLGEWHTVPGELRVSSTEAAAWTLRYPTLFLSRSIGASPWAEAIRAYEDGRLVEALIAFEETPVEARDADYFVYNAHFLLLVGDEAEAGAELGKALAMAPEHPGAQALQAIAAVREGRGDAALALARRAVAGDPTLPATHLALSYAYQASRDLPAARASADAAIRLDPDNALTHLRLAELDLATGDIAAARSRADRAVALSPTLADANNVLGFVQLSQDRPELAVDTFKSAIRYNAQEPAGHFGLGLAYVRQGKPDLGREQLEIATKLAPANALPHTYLGRTYALLGRDREAAEQYAAAIKADPLDPVPYRFDAVRLAAANAPVSASARMQAALDRVDKRAVYRATDLLAEDRALYLADLANLEGVLGQDDRARLDATRAVAQDFTSDAAHQAVGDALAKLPRAGLASQSEYLQTLLRAPLGAMPPPLKLAEGIQPGAVVPQQGFFRAATPERVGYNEFGALFGGAEHRIDLDMTAGDHGSLGDQLRAATAVGKVGLSLSQLYFQTDGFGAFDAMDNSILRGVMQFDPNPDTRFHVEYQSTNGNRQGVVFPDDAFFIQQQTVDETRDRGRLAFHHRFDGGSELTVLASREDMDQSIDTLPSPLHINTLHDKQKVRDDLVEAQYALRSGAMQVVTGLSYVRARQSNVFGEQLIDFYPNDGVVDLVYSAPPYKASFRTLTGYAYTTYQAHPGLELQAGLSADGHDQAAGKQHLLSPKFGLSWRVVANGTLRLAAMRGLNRFFLAGASLEPATVAGFQQHFSDSLGIRSDRVGLGWDQRLVDGWDWGFELSQRRLRLPLNNFVDPYDHWREGDSRLWLNKRMKSGLPAGWEGIVTLAYDGQDYERHETFIGFEQLRDYQPRHLRLGGRFFQPTGWGLDVGLTWVDAKRVGEDVLGVQTTFKDSFPVLDAVLTWQLPRQRGQLSLGAMNLFDRSFDYLEMDPASPRFAPERYVYARLRLEF